MLRSTAKPSQTKTPNFEITCQRTPHTSLSCSSSIVATAPPHFWNDNDNDNHLYNGNLYDNNLPTSAMTMFMITWQQPLTCGWNPACGDGDDQETGTWKSLVVRLLILIFFIPSKSSYPTQTWHLGCWSWSSEWACCCHRQSRGKSPPALLTSWTLSML